jgi:2-keto-4-pentenoate hydratase/2-oxohepta-3-ene-1,7-dioic acid hydratase in catechol pathway
LHRPAAERIIGIPLRLVTFDRRGHRRLGALLDGEVVDLPDAVGHPAFPATMERLVRSNGGTVLDAARAALERDEAKACVVERARLLAPIIPASLRSADAADGSRRVFGPGDEVPWPPGAGWLEFHPKIAAVLRRPIRDPLAPEEVPSVVFGYTLIGDWLARNSNGDPIAAADGVPMSIGPCVVTPDELDPQAAFLSVRVDGEEWVKGNLNGAAGGLLREVAHASRHQTLSPGDAFASGPFEAPGAEQRLWPGAEVALEAEGIGVLRNRLARPR